MQGSVLVIMSTFLYTLLGLSLGDLHCSMRQEISPCTCNIHGSTLRVICEKMTSFSEVVNALQDKFPPDSEIALKISYSQLPDLGDRNFQELHFGISHLKLNYDNLSLLSPDTFSGLEQTGFLSFSDNYLTEIPVSVLQQTPRVRTLDLGRNHIHEIGSADLANLGDLETLVISGNNISRLENGSFPRSIRYLQIARNQLHSLNNTIRDLNNLEWLFLNENNVTSLQGQLPIDGKLHFLYAERNMIEKLTPDFRMQKHLKHLFLQHNRLQSLEGGLPRARRLKQLVLSHNKIDTLMEDDFLELENLEDLHLGYNEITSLNSSLLPMRSLRRVNLTKNLLDGFSLDEIRGLRHLSIIDLSHNHISKLGGRVENLVELETRVSELRLDYNELQSLDGALMGLNGLQRLNVSHNHLENISPDDLIGLDDLRILDISFNQLTTLQETSKTFLPSLKSLLASHNALSYLDQDFHGLPELCFADLSHNLITILGEELAGKTRCNTLGIPSTLKLHLEGNPLECNEQLANAVDRIKKDHTVMFGVPQCTIVTSYNETVGTE